MLNTSNLGYRINPKGDIISDLLFMYNLKLFTTNNIQLASILELASIIKIVNKFSDNIRISFGIEKCKKLTIQRGKTVQMENIYLDNVEEIKSLELNRQHKYLGLEKV